MPKSRKMVKFRIWDKVSEGNILLEKPEVPYNKT